MLGPELIPGSRVYHRPLHVRNIDELEPYEKLELGLASKSYKWHWERRRNPYPYRPSERQQKFFDLSEKYKFTAFVGGAGSGKTASGAAWAVKMATDNPGSVGLVLAPTYKMLKSATRVEFDACLQREGISARNEQDGILRLTNGTTIWFRSTENPEGFRGITAAWAILQTIIAARWKREAKKHQARALELAQENAELKNKLKLEGATDNELLEEFERAFGVDAGDDGSG